MKKVDLIKVEHNRKVGDICEYIEPNVTEDCIFYVDNEPIGFYLEKMTEKMCKLADLANSELQSKNVPKQGTVRITEQKKAFDEKRKTRYEIKQYSTIIGSVPKNEVFKRHYENRSSVHSVKSAQTFIKAMLMLAYESEQIIKEILPEQYEKQIELFKDIKPKWRFGNLFTSSISNFNISAPFHKDTGNLVGAVNVIICKQKNSKGGDLHIPDYNATIGQADNSMLVYPAWRNVHGVTPIIPTFEGGYRNSLVFYPLKAFVGID